jgi:hypothetical protein
VRDQRRKTRGMLRVPQHERKVINEINSPPFVLS